MYKQMKSSIIDINVWINTNRNIQFFFDITLNPPDGCDFAFHPINS